VPNEDSGIVSVIAAATNTVTGTIGAGMANAVAVDPHHVHRQRERHRQPIRDRRHGDHRQVPDHHHRL
jgi:hypothetical protein